MTFTLGHLRRGPTTLRDKEHNEDLLAAYERWTRLEVIVAYRLDDPYGRVGIENHLVQADGTILHVPRAVLHNDRFTLTVLRRAEPGPRPALGLTATWPWLPAPVVLAEVVDNAG